MLVYHIKIILLWLQNKKFCYVFNLNFWGSNSLYYFTISFHFIFMLILLSLIYSSRWPSSSLDLIWRIFNIYLSIINRNNLINFLITYRYQYRLQFQVVHRVWDVIYRIFISILLIWILKLIQVLSYFYVLLILRLSAPQVSHFLILKPVSLFFRFLFGFFSTKHYLFYVLKPS